MSVARHQGAFGAWIVRWVAAARLLAVVLVLAGAAPLAGLGGDAAVHGGAPSAPIAADGGASHPADPGIAGHAHCGCHQAASLDQGMPAPVRDAAARPRYALTRQDPTSVVRARPARPPRA